MTPRRALLALAVAIAACTALAQQHPNQEKGFDPTKLYHFADIDSINTFNGNLIVTLPLTQTFRVGPLLSYSFTPVYNANVWDARSYDPNLLQLTPCRRCNAGLGWILSLGRLIPPSDPTNSQIDPNHGFLYESPDGRDHPFTVTPPGTPMPYYVFAKDESGLRMQITDTTKTIEFPDGTRRKFFTDGNDAWKLFEVSDPFGNRLLIDYSRSTPGHDIWDVTEQQQATVIRRHSLEFNVTSDGSDANNGPGTTFAQTYLTKVIVGVPSFGGASTEYDFNYTRAALLLPQDDTTHPANDIPTNTIHEFLLTSVDLVTKDSTGVPLAAPLLGSYSMALPDGYDTCSNSRCNSSGLLRSLRLPTGGTYRWSYTDTGYPHPRKTVEDPQYVLVPLQEHRQSMVAVHTRQLTDLGSNQPSTWYYTYVPSRELCNDSQSASWYRWRQTATAVTGPDGTTNVNYYSIYQDGDPCDTGIEWATAEYGLPLTHFAPEASGLLLSTETYTGAPPTSDPAYSAPTPDSGRLIAGTLKRTKRIANGSLFSPSGFGTFSPAIERTYYNDDNVAGQFTEVIRSGQDNAGHYKQTSSGGRIGVKADGTIADPLYRTTFTNYPSLPISSITTISPWLFGTYTEQCSRVESSPRDRDTITACSASAGGLSNGSPSVKDFNWKQFCFDGQTGFLKGQRAIRLIAPGDGDVVAQFTPSSTGDVASEAYYGGEDVLGNNQLPMPIVDLCSNGFGNALYTMNHTYVAGSLLTSAYAGTSFNLVDRQIDPNTGLVTVDKDAAGLATHYDYDSAGRITALTPPLPLAATSFAYTPAVTSGTVANAYAVSTQSGTPDEGKRESKYVFDGFGRVTRELSLTDTGSQRGHDTAYDAFGRKTSETTTAIFDAAYPPTTKTTTIYDFAGRPTSITAPDNTSTIFAYQGIRQIDRSVKIATLASLTADSKTTETHDALGRLASVQEPYGPATTDTTTTLYGYDAADRLITVDMTGEGSTQHRIFAYDNRGFLKSETHPELGVHGNGTITYQGYDPRGHARRKITGSAFGSFDLAFEFDAAERLKTVSHQTSPTAAETLKSFSYGDTLPTPPANSKGKLVTASRFNSVGNPAKTVRVDEEYHYTGPAGLLSDKKTTVTSDSAPVQTFSQSYTYSSLGDLATLTYPSLQGGNAGRTVTNLNKNGFLTGVSGYASGITYTQAGLVGTITHADGSLDTYSPDAHGMPRPGEIQFSNFSDCAAPAAPTISAPAAVCPSSSNSASVPQNASFAYSWAITGGAITSGGSSSTVTFTAGSSGVVHLTVTAANECGSTPSSADVNISTTPSAPAISAPPSVCPSSSANTASVPQNSAWTYVWSATGGTITSGGSTSTATFTAGSSGVVHLSVTITSCGTTTSTADVAITGPPSTPTITAPTSVLPSSTNNAASVPQNASLTYSWSASGGTITSGGSTSAIQFTAGASGTVHLTVTVTTACNSSASGSKDVPISSQTPAPTSVEAHAISSSTISVSWSPVSSATGYRVLRATLRSDDENGNWETRAEAVTSTSIVDGAAANTAYIYRVQANSSAGFSQASPMDIATSVIFTDDPNHVIRAVDWTQMRTAVRALCVAAQLTDMSQCAFTDVGADGLTMVPGTAVKLIHLTELRRGLDHSYSALHLAPVQYGEPSPVQFVTVIRLQQVNEIRGGVK
jgi:YD repeat-containing protein